MTGMSVQLTGYTSVYAAPATPNEVLAVRLRPLTKPSSDATALELPDDLLIVGEHNPHGTDPRYALYPEPSYSAGGRLVRILGIERQALIDAWRANLCPHGWAHAEAMRRAALLLDGPWRRYVLCGSRVRGVIQRLTGHRHDTKSQSSVYAWRDGERRFLAIPHPSGRSRRWQEPGLRDDVLQRFAETLS